MLDEEMQARLLAWESILYEDIDEKHKARLIEAAAR